MSLLDPLPIRPFTKPVHGEVTLPGSKSITNRALLLAALCDGPVALTGALFSDDTRLMAGALRKLGIPVAEDEAEKTIHVQGQGGKIPAEYADLFVGNAGTAARFLTALCAAAPRGVYQIDGVPQMRKRPMKGLIDALRAQGAKITCTGEQGFFPITIEAHGLQGGELSIDASESSQMLSALLMVAPLAKKSLGIKPGSGVRMPFVEMTGKFMTYFTGLSVSRRPDGTYNPVLLTAEHRYRSKGTYAIEPDATAASYFLALPLVIGGSLYLPGLQTDKTLQGDTEFIHVLLRVGAEIADRTEPVMFSNEDNELEESYRRSIGVDSKFSRSSARQAIAQDFTEFSDTFLTLAAISPLLEGKTTITGIAHTRKQETDRVAGMARELTKLGQQVVETDDSLEITPNLDELRKRAVQRVIEIETYDDHRFAMSFAILGCHDLLKNGRPWLSIKNPACCAKTFPDFFDVLESVRRSSEMAASPRSSP
jgi:3-phosphoshikimate 1-carboxyvinyltransferase